MFIIPSLEGGGAERVASLLSIELSKKYNLYFVVFDSDNIAYQYGGKLEDIEVKSSNSKIKKIINVIKRAYKVKKLKKHYSISTTVSFMESANIVNVLSRKNDKVIISIHNHLYKDNNIFNKIINRLNNKADNIIGVSKGVTEHLIKNYNLDCKESDYIYNPVDIEEIKILGDENILSDDSMDEDCFKVITMGRLTKQKGQWHLIRAFSEVVKERPNAKLYILGDGELEVDLKKLAKELGLKENVIFLGYQANPFKYIKKSDLFAFSSLYEGFGNVLVEAMACGTPVISTDCKSGPKEIIAPEIDLDYKIDEIVYAEYGVLVPICDGVMYDSNSPITHEEKLLAEGIINIQKDSLLRKKYVDKSLERSRIFDIYNISKEWENIID